MTWYCYLESKISFPIPGKVPAAKVISPLKRVETVDVIRMAPDDVCEHAWPGPLAGPEGGRPPYLS